MRNPKALGERTFQYVEAMILGKNQLFIAFGVKVL